VNVPSKSSSAASAVLPACVQRLVLLQRCTRWPAALGGICSPCEPALPLGQVIQAVATVSQGLYRDVACTIPKFVIFSRGYLIE